MRSKRTRDVIIMSVAAQEDNLGDIEIRKELFEWVCGTGIEILAYRGAMTDSYMASFMGGAKLRWFKSMVAMQLAIIKSLSSGKRIHFFLAPGPEIFSSGLAQTFKSVINYVNSTLAHLSRGTVHIAGRSYRGKGLSGLFSKAIARGATTCCVRDKLSSKPLGFIVDVLPDLAFGRRLAVGNKKRKLIVITARNEGGVNLNHLSSLVMSIRDMGYIPVLLSQVRRDDKFMSEAALLTDVDLFHWAEKSHQQQAECIKSIYSEAFAVISNRLHALIIGAKFGAVPVPLLGHENKKLMTTLEVVIPAIKSIDIDDVASMGAIDFSSKIDSNGENLEKELRSASLLLDERRRLIVSYIS